MVAVISEVAFLADFGFRRSLDDKVFIQDLGDYLVKVGAGSIYQLRPIGKDHQGVFFFGLAGPVEEEAVGVFFVALL